MKFLSAKQVADKWNVSERYVQKYCIEGKIQGATKFGKVWQIPENAKKPHDQRTRKAKAFKKLPHQDFMIPPPKQNPFLFHTDLYTTPGTAESVIERFSDYPETARIMKAQLNYRQGKIDEIYDEIDHFLVNHKGIYSCISAGILLAYCAIGEGDINLWQKARQHIYNAPCKTENERKIVEFWLCVIDSKINDIRYFPKWFTKGQFDCLPSDSFCSARVYYIRYQFVLANELAHGKLQLPDVEGLGLMRTLPYFIEPMLSQAIMEKTIIPQIYLRLLGGVVYHNLGDDKKAIEHIDKAIELCMPDRLFGILVEYRTNLDTLLDDRLALVDESVLNEVKRIHKKTIAGWRKLHNELLERNISHTLTVREREVAKLAAFGLTNNEIASRLNIEVSSVKQYIFSTMNKVGAEKRTELGLYV